VLLAALVVVALAAAAVLIGDDDTDPDEDPGADPARGGTVAVDLEPIDGFVIEGFDVTLRFYGPDGDTVAQREWTDAVTATEATDDIDAFYSYVLHEPVPSGRVRVVSFLRLSPGDAIPPPEGPGCETTVDVAPGDTARITLLQPGSPDWACAALTSATAEADGLLDLPRGLPAPGFVGLTEGEATAEAASRGWTIRVLARDGRTTDRDDDYRTDRVNLVLQGDTVTAAART